jgi:5'(3')-deoxyribonucleotidase
MKIENIFVDADEVLISFLSGCKKLLGIELNDFSWCNEESKWNEINKLDPHFWLNLELMPEAKVLWNYIKHYDPFILTACPGYHLSPLCAEQKKQYFTNSEFFCLPDYKCIAVPHRENKANYATSNNIPNLLIDDMTLNISEWKEAGGIGILHESVPKTIKILMELGL